MRPFVGGVDAGSARILQRSAGCMLSWDTAESEVAEIGTCYFAASSQAAKNGDLKAVQE